MARGDGRSHSSADFDAQQQNMVKLVRAVFLILLVTFTAMIIVKDSATESGVSLVEWWPQAVVGTLLFYGLFVAIDHLTPKRKLSTITAVFVGLIVGVVVTGILSLGLDLFTDIYELAELAWLAPFKIILGIGITYLTVTTVLQTQDDFRLVIPYVEFAKKIRGTRPFVLDSSALIDGRILDISEVGVFQSPMIVPRFVVEELQRLSDSGDKMKRARGRRGLEMVARLQRTAKVEVSIEDSDVAGAGVDQRLVALSKEMPATIVTTDLGLVRVAGIEGATVLNVNDLANALKPVVIPGEPLSVRLLRKGEQPGQAVGYLQDGTMVVADQADDLIGESVLLTVTSTTQTSAGRLIFGRPVVENETPDLPDEVGASSDGVPAEPVEADEPAVVGASPGPASSTAPVRTGGGGRARARNPRRNS